MLVGYARVSTQDQNPDLQLDVLAGASRERVFTEKRAAQGPKLAEALDYMRAGETLVIWKLDRLARSLKQLIETVEALSARRRSALAHRGDRHHHRRRAARLPCLWRPRRIRARGYP